jgi:hypothetical protein
LGGGYGVYERKLPKPLPPAEGDPARRLGIALCAADIKRARSAVSLSFDSPRDRDTAWLELHRIREAAQKL